MKIIYSAMKLVWYAGPRFLLRRKNGGFITANNPLVLDYAFAVH